MNTDYILAQKYAQAFLNLYQDKLSLADISCLQKVSTLLQERPALCTYLGIPLGNKYKESCFNQIIQAYRIPKYFKNLTNLLIYHHRTYLFMDILKAIVKEFYKRNNYMEFTSISSHKLKKSMGDSIHHFLERVTKKQILSTVKIDPTLIVGIRLQSNELLWENSIKNRLQRAARLFDEGIV